MSNIIVENGRRILRISNRGLQALEKRITLKLEKETIQDIFLTHFMEEMDQDTFGPGMIYLDVNIFKDNPISFKQFIDLVKEAYSELLNEKYYDQSYKDIMDPFIVELGNYYNKIKLV